MPGVVLTIVGKCGMQSPGASLVGAAFHHRLVCAPQPDIAGVRIIATMLPEVRFAIGFPSQIRFPSLGARSVSAFRILFRPPRIFAHDNPPADSCSPLAGCLPSVVSQAASICAGALGFAPGVARSERCRSRCSPSGTPRGWYRACPLDGRSSATPQTFRERVMRSPYQIVG